MKKLISMLLAVSMSLSVICGSFTVAAVDGNDAAAQTEIAAQSGSTVFEGSFASEINEKIAERSNDCGISSVEVSGSTATVSYWSSKDCTVIVGIYENDGTNGTHMLTFGTANVTAAGSKASVRIDNLPQYFYLKAYLVDSESYSPLASVYMREYNRPDDMTKRRENMLDVEKSLQETIGSDEYQNADVDGRKEQMDASLASLKEQRLISDYWFNEHGNTYSFEYAYGGSGGVILEAFDSETDGFGDSFEDDYNDYFSDIYNAISTLAANNTLGRELNILLFDGFENIPKKDGNNVVYDNRLKYYTGDNGVITKLKENFNVNIEFDSNVTVQDFSDIGKKGSYDIVVFAMHGMCVNNKDENNQKWGLFLNESYESVENVPELYGIYEINDRISFYYHVDGRAYIDVYSDFFGSHNTDWSAKVVYLSACAGFGCKVETNDAVVKYAGNFLSIPSVEAVVGYYNSVNSAYNRKILTEFIAGMCSGKTVMESIKSAREKHGNDDGYEDPDNHKYKSSPKMVGDPDFKFSEIVDVRLDTVPDKTTYSIGEEFDGTGGKITLVYSDGSTKTYDLTSPDIASNIEIINFDSSKAGSSKVCIKFTDDRNIDFTTKDFMVTINSSGSGISGGYFTLENNRIYLNLTYYETSDEFKLNLWGVDMISVLKQQSTPIKLGDLTITASYTCTSIDDIIFTMSWTSESGEEKTIRQVGFNNEQSAVMDAIKDNNVTELSVLPEEIEFTESTEAAAYPQPTEPQTETAEVNETPTFGNDSSGVFSFGRSGRKTAQYANLHKNDIYNYYVVRNASANLLDKDNLLFVGQGSSDSMGSLSFEYETTTGEDGTIILRPMSDDPTTPDTPNQPTAPGNGGSSTNTNPSMVIPVGGTKTETMTVKVENKVTGKTSKAIAQKTGSSVTVRLGTENNGYYANVYTTDDEYVYSALIENGRAKFNVPDDVKLKIVIDSISYGEDVSSAAGAAADGEPVDIPYPVVVVLIAVFGIYIKAGKKISRPKEKC